MHRLSLVLLLVTAACGSSSPDGGGDVVGSWRAIPSEFDDTPTPEAERRWFTFGADGTFEHEDGFTDGIHTGTYETAGGRLLLTPDGTDDHADLGYYADAGGFVFGTMTPDDDGADAIATWTGYSEGSTRAYEITLVLRDDNTLHLDQWSTNGGEASYDGTWTQLDNDIELTYGNEQFTTRTPFRLYGGVMGEQYEPI